MQFKAAILSAYGVFVTAILFAQQQESKSTPDSVFLNVALQDLSKLRTIDFTRGIIYFSGSGFPVVLQTEASNKARLNNFLAVSKPGTIITLENCFYKDSIGKIKVINKQIKLR